MSHKTPQNKKNGRLGKYLLVKMRNPGTVNIYIILKGVCYGSSPAAQQVKDSVSSLQQLGSLLWLRFDPWRLGTSTYCRHSQKKKVCVL